MTLTSSALRHAATSSSLIYACKQSLQSSPLPNEGRCKPDGLCFLLSPEIFSTLQKELHKFFPWPPAALIPEISWIQLQMTQWRATHVLSVIACIFVSVVYICVWTDIHTYLLLYAHENKNLASLL